MARAVRPTLQQKKIIVKNNLVADNWLVTKDTDTELKIVSKANGRTRTIKKSA